MVGITCLKVLVQNACKHGEGRDGKGAYVVEYGQYDTCNGIEHDLAGLELISKANH